MLALFTAETYDNNAVETEHLQLQTLQLILLLNSPLVGTSILQIEKLIAYSSILDFSIELSID